MNNQEAMPFECPAMEELAEFLNGDLTTNKKADIEEHLASCSKCRRLVCLAFRTKEFVVDPPDAAIT
jgi:predicted anti-sigma-YlaC factor YlaD